MEVTQVYPLSILIFNCFSLSFLFFFTLEQYGIVTSRMLNCIFAVRGLLCNSFLNFIFHNFDIFSSCNNLVSNFHKPATGIVNMYLNTSEWVISSVPKTHKVFYDSSMKFAEWSLILPFSQALYTCIFLRVGSSIAMSPLNLKHPLFISQLFQIFFALRDIMALWVYILKSDTRLQSPLWTL